MSRQDHPDGARPHRAQAWCCATPGSSRSSGHLRTRPEATPTAGVGDETVATADIPLNTDLAIGQVENADVDSGLLRHQVRLLGEMNRTMLTLHRVIGLTTVHPAAVNADAHASSIR